MTTYRKISNWLDKWFDDVIKHSNQAEKEMLASAICIVKSSAKRKLKGGD